MASNLDPIQQQESVANRRKMLEALLQQSQDAKIQGYGAHPYIQGIAKVASAYLGNQNLQGLDREAQQARTDYGTQLGGEVEKYLSTRQGTPGTETSDPSGFSFMQGEQKADPRKAIVQAMSSRFPEMQALGASDIRSLGSSGYKDSEVNGKIVRTYQDGTTKILGDFKDKPEEWETYQEGERLMRRNKGTGKVEQVYGPQRPLVQVNTAQKGDLSYMGELDKSIAPGGKSYDPASGAVRSLDATTQALGAINQGASTGTGEPIIQAARGLGERIGIKDAATAPTGQLDGLLKGRVFNRLGSLGAQVSNSDREFIENASGGLSANPLALKTLLAYQTAADMKEISRHNRVVDQRAAASDNPELFSASKLPFSVTFENDPEFASMVERAMQGKPVMTKEMRAKANALPAPGITPPGGTPLSLDDYLKSKGVK